MGDKRPWDGGGGGGTNADDTSTAATTQRRTLSLAVDASAVASHADTLEKLSRVVNPNPLTPKPLNPRL